VAAEIRSLVGPEASVLPGTSSLTGVLVLVPVFGPSSEVGGLTGQLPRLHLIIIAERSLKHSFICLHYVFKFVLHDLEDAFGPDAEVSVGFV
jgi:hypothetical protein